MLIALRTELDRVLLEYILAGTLAITPHDGTVFILIPGTRTTGGCFSSSYISQTVLDLQILAAHVANAQARACREGAVFREAEYKTQVRKVTVEYQIEHTALLSLFPLRSAVATRPIERRLRGHHAGLLCGGGEVCNCFQAPALVNVVFE